jgi:hypothetical protein
VGPVEAVGSPTRGCALTLLWTAIVIPPILVSHIKCQVVNFLLTVWKTFVVVYIFSLEYGEVISVYTAV